MKKATGVKAMVGADLCAPPVRRADTQVGPYMGPTIERGRRRPKWNSGRIKFSSKSWHYVPVEGKERWILICQMS